MSRISNPRGITDREKYRPGGTINALKKCEVLIDVLSGGILPSSTIAMTAVAVNNLEIEQRNTFLMLKSGSLLRKYP